MTVSPPPALTLSWMDSPIGPLALACDEAGGVRGVSFGEGLIKAMRREYPGAALADVLREERADVLTRDDCAGCARSGRLFRR